MNSLEDYIEEYEPLELNKVKKKKKNNPWERGKKKNKLKKFKEKD